jgi:L-threonylcarbamoyladenylate synthase
VLTSVLAVNPDCLEPEKYDRIIGVLNGGGVIVYPTDTFYGLGANAFRPGPIERIYALKGRDRSKPLLAVIADVEMVERVAREIPPVFRDLAARFWPGPLTLVLEAAPSLPRELLGRSDSIAVRLPDVLWLRAMIRRAGFPVVATSANLSGGTEVATAEEALALFNGKVELIVDGGGAPGTRPSTILDLTGGRPRLVREGALSRAALEGYL